MRALILALVLTGCEAGEQFQTPPVNETTLLDTPQIDAYAKGATAVVEFLAFNLAEFEVVSQDTDVASVQLSWVDEESGQVLALLSCDDVGDTDVVLYDADDLEVDRVPVSVRLADRVSLVPSLQVLTQVSEPDDAPRVVVGGIASFEVRWYSGDDERLSPPDWSVSANNLWIEGASGDSRHWLRVAPEFEGEHVVTMRHDDTVFAELTATAVPPEAITGVDLFDRPTASNVRALAAIAHDADGTPVWGTEYQWFVRNRPVEATGDVYLYTPDPDLDVPIVAELGDLEVEGRLHGPGGAWSSNELGCSSLGGTAVTLVWLLPAVALVRRRHPVA